MSSHGMPRTVRPRTEDQIKQDLEKIEKYRALEDRFRQQVSESRFDQDTLQLTTKLLRINPEYYTVWNARRRCLISGPLSKPLRGSSPSTESPSTLPNASHTSSSAASSPRPLAETQPPRDHPQAGKSGTTHDESDAGKEIDASEANESKTTEAEEVIRSELMFTVPLLMEHPKCYWIWNYRTWTLEQATKLLVSHAAKTIWKEELGLVTKMLQRDRRNFHAWQYRRYVVSQLESPTLYGKSMAEEEFEYTTKMINNDLSNFSAWHNRSQLIPRLLQGRKADSVSRKAFLEQELSLVGGGLNVGPEDQSLWYYHQYLMLNVGENPSGRAIAPEMTVDERAECIAQEIENIKDLLEDYEDVKWIYQSLLEYTLLRHQLAKTSLSPEEKNELESWLAKIRGLDQQRSGRWTELANELKLSA